VATVKAATLAAVALGAALTFAAGGGEYPADPEEPRSAAAPELTAPVPTPAEAKTLQALDDLEAERLELRRELAGLRDVIEQLLRDLAQRPVARSTPVVVPVVPRAWPPGDVVRGPYAGRRGRGAWHDDDEAQAP
jgi:hypothetical protein